MRVDKDVPVEVLGDDLYVSFREHNVFEIPHVCLGRMDARCLHGVMESGVNMLCNQHTAFTCHTCGPMGPLVP